MLLMLWTWTTGSTSEVHRLTGCTDLEGVVDSIDTWMAGGMISPEGGEDYEVDGPAALGRKGPTVARVVQ